VSQFLEACQGSASGRSLDVSGFQRLMSVNPLFKLRKWRPREETNIAHCTASYAELNSTIRNFSVARSAGQTVTVQEGIGLAAGDWNDAGKLT
jgi:hypothetical protein